jgi:hypothetical protein
METLIDQIRAAVADGATDDAQQAGANACRSILAALDARHATNEVSASANSAPSAVPSTAAPSAPRPASAPCTVGELPALVAIRAVPRGQILDYVIEKLRALQPEAQASATLTSAIGALRNLSLDQLVDLGVAKLHTALAPRPAIAPALPEGTRVIRLAPAPARR